MTRIGHWLAGGAAAGALLLAGACDRIGIAPENVRSGWRLPFEEGSDPVTDWGFAAGSPEIALEVDAPWGWHSVTIWCVVLGGRLYIATDDGRERKRWVRGLDSDRKARVGIGGRAYAVQAHRVVELALWNRVIAAFRDKYGADYEKYDFPEPDDLSTGRIYELRSRS